MEAFAHPSYMFADPYTHNVDRRGKMRTSRLKV